MAKAAFAPLPVRGWLVGLTAGKVSDNASYANRYNINGANFNQVFSFRVRIKQEDLSGIRRYPDGDRLVSYDLYDKKSSVASFWLELRMLIPPEEFKIEYKHSVPSDKVRAGWKFHKWGMELDTIEASGSTAAFMHSTQGLTVRDADATLAYREMTHLLQMYRNNGVSLEPNSGVIDTIGEIVLGYDGKLYRGSFNSLNIAESADTPYQFKYDFTFTVRGEYGPKETKVMGHHDVFSSIDRSKFNFGRQQAAFSPELDLNISKMIAGNARTRSEFREGISLFDQKYDLNGNPPPSPLFYKDVVEDRIVDLDVSIPIYPTDGFNGVSTASDLQLQSIISKNSQFYKNYAKGLSLYKASNYIDEIDVEDSPVLGPEELSEDLKDPLEEII